MKEKIFTLIFVCSTFAATNPVQAAGNAAAGQEKAKVCVACHMLDGNSVNPIWPKLSGQPASYTIRQLTQMKNGARPNELMKSFVAALSEQDIEDLAAYFETQQRSPGTSDPKLAAAGDQVYNKGDYLKGMLACKGCHGQSGQGNPTWEAQLGAPPSVLAPGLAGQHSAYIELQLKAFRSGTRDNDVNGVMRNITKNMTDEEIVAVSSYISGK